MHVYKELEIKYQHALCRLIDLFKYGYEREQKLESLIAHCSVHSGHKNCGYKQMTTDQKKLFDSLTVDNTG